MNRSAFTLIEMLVATVLSAVLMSAVLAMLAGVARDRRSVNSMNAASVGNGVIDLFRWDFASARSFSRGIDDQSIVLTGLGGIDPASLTPNGRCVQVTYRTQSTGSTRTLWRTQEYLDDPVKPAVWQEMVATEVTAFSVEPAPSLMLPVPGRIRLRLATANCSIDQQLWIK